MSNCLKDAVKYSNTRISLSDINTDNYITTDNLLQNKQGKNKAESLPPNINNVTEYLKGDILLSNIRPYLKKIWYASNSGGNSADVLTLRVNNRFNSKFIYYCLLQDIFFEHMMNGSKGTKMPRGDKKQILDFPIPEYTIPTQHSIAKVLSDLDEKIELNNKINKDLESMAKTLYDYWFVQFDFPNEEGKPYKSSGGKMVYNAELKREIPDGWEVKSISEWIKNYKSGDWGQDIIKGNYKLKVNCIRGADINGLKGNDVIKAPERFIQNKNSDRKLVENDLIVEISGGSPTQSTGRIAFITETVLNRFQNPLICSNFCKALTLNDEKYLYNFFYQWERLYENGVLFDWEGKTSGIKNLLFESFTSNHLEPYPNRSIVEKFYLFTSSIHTEKQKSINQNQQLAELRDWLLPMLMNGQVKVS